MRARCKFVMPSYGFVCISPFENRAILEVVKEIYLGQLWTPNTLKPSQMVMLAIKTDEPPGKPLKECLSLRVS